MSAPSPLSSPTYLVDKQPHRLLNAWPPDQHVSAHRHFWQLWGDGGAPQRSQALAAQGGEDTSHERNHIQQRLVSEDLLQNLAKEPSFQSQVAVRSQICLPGPSHHLPGPCAPTCTEHMLSTV